MKDQSLQPIFDQAFNQLYSNTERLEKINALQRHIENLGAPPLDCQLKHHFAPSTYGREILLPADSLVIGKTHRHAHLNIISQGMVTVATEHGVTTYVAPCTFVSEVGTKRAVYAHEDTIWTTIHPNLTNTTDTDQIEAEIIVPPEEVQGFRASVGLEVLQLQGEQQ